MELAEVLDVVWAKSYPVGRRPPEEWLPLTRHLDDTAAVAMRLWDEWLPTSVRMQISASLTGPDDGRLLTAFLAGVHDVGKASPAFTVQVPILADRVKQVTGLPLAAIPEGDRRNLRHDLAGQVVVESWLRDRHGWDRLAARQLGVVVGGHHGVPPETDHLRTAAGRTRSHLLGTGAWNGVRQRLIERTADRVGATEAIARWRAVRLSQPVQVLLTAIVIVADWIASNRDLFPLVPVHDEQPGFDDDARVRQAWKQLDLPRPWQPTLLSSTPAELLRNRFGLPPDAEIRPVQEQAVHTATDMDLPGIMVVEAPMGEGKTEAALLAAEVLAARSGASGCFVALPTQATTDAMFARVLRWLARLPDARLAADANTEQTALRAVTLAHGKAMLNATFGELRMPGRPESVAPDEVDERGRVVADAIAHQWFSGRKKGPLADFVVGTIDQLLFAGLRARHLALRHLGLAGKVVVIDEAHAYDAYMNHYLERVLEWLGAYRVPVVLLSATLPTATRARLIDSYRRGAGDVGREVRESSAEQAYPAVTAIRDGSVATAAVGASGRAAEVRVETADDELATVHGVLAEALADGGCALVVRNTVSRAQQAARALRQHFGDDVELAHSRYIGHDRLAKDAWLRDRFGPPGHASDRPERSIVVATQVVEQSLDVDFDLLVTDLAPIDLVLQRIGRMHRHVRNRPARLRTPRCVVVGVADWQGAPPRPVSGIYHRHALYRAAALIRETVDGDGVIRLPDDIAPLVQRAYGGDVLGDATWQPAVAAARREFDDHVARQRSAANTFRLLPPAAPGTPITGWLAGHVGDVDDTPQGQAEVRDSEDSLEVLLLLRDGGQLRVPDWLDGDDDGDGGRPLPLNASPPDDLARTVAGSALRLPAHVVAGAKGDQLIAALEQNWYPELQAHRLLAGQLILALDAGTWTTYGPWSFRYDTRDGLEVTAHE